MGARANAKTDSALDGGQRRRAMKATPEARKGIREKLQTIDRIKKTSPQDAEQLNDLTAKWYAANDKGIVLDAEYPKMGNWGKDKISKIKTIYLDLLPSSYFIGWRL